jgi:hypothetical protein
VRKEFLTPNQKVAEKEEERPKLRWEDGVDSDV